MSALDPAAALLDNPLRELTFVCGAGISRNPPASLPTVATFLAAALDHCRLSAGIRRSIERKSLRANAPRFEVLVDGIRELNDPHLELAGVFDTTTFNRLHSLLAAFLARGSSIVTTNFDNGIEIASGAAAIRRIAFQGVDLVPRRDRHAGLLLKPHGSSPLPGESTARLVLSIRELSLTSGGFRRYPNWRRLLLDQFRHRTVVAIGYSGSDDFDLSPLLREAGTLRVLWFQHAAAPNYPAASPRRVPLRLRRFREAAALHYFVGALDELAAQVGHLIGATLATGPPAGPRLAVTDYFMRRFGDRALREELKNLILLHYDLYRSVVARSSTSTQRTSLQRAKALFRLGRHDDALAELAAVDGTFAAPEERFQALYYESSALAAAGRLDNAISAAMRLVQLAEAEHPRGLIRSLNQLGGILFQAQRFDDAAAAFERALDAQRLAASLDGEATSLWGLGIVAQIRGDHASFLTSMERARELFGFLGDESNHAWCEYNLGDACYYLGRMDEALRHFETALRTFGKLHSRLGHLYVSWMMGKMAYLRKDWAAALSRFTAVAGDLAIEAGFPWVLDFWLLYTAARLRLHRPSFTDPFTGHAFSQRLAQLDASAGHPLHQLLNQAGDSEIAVAEDFAFRTGTELAVLHHTRIGN